jgi:tetratricopeptide (TPR) repeat protein
MSDVAQTTNQLNFLVSALHHHGQYLTEEKDYETAIKAYLKMLKVCWINNDNRNELKVYEMLALQYFYKQDINSCKKFLDRSLRGKLESTSSSSRKAVVL